MPPHLKLAIASVLQLVPGPIGERFETTALWTRRQLRARSSGSEFEHELTKLDRSSICIDLGANVGDITDRLAAVAGHVHAFEPDPWAFGQLQERAANWNNVTLHNCAIGVRDGTLTLLRDPDLAERPEVRSQGTSVFSSLLWRDAEPGQFEVPVIDVRRFLRSLGNDVALMKVDIEGSEVELLETLVESDEMQAIHVLFVETHECQIPQLRKRTAALRKRLGDLARPRVYLEWH